jgi:sulfide:quinone oxidoreductase
MKIFKIDDTISVGGQITTADVQQLNDDGFKSIICNRPDDEEMTQTSFADIEKAAKVLGMEVRYVPIFHAGMSMEDVEDFGAARDAMIGPHFAYCRSGMRTSSIWAMHQATTGVAVDEILSKTASAGYNLEHMSGALTQLAENAN